MCMFFFKRCGQKSDLLSKAEKMEKRKEQNQFKNKILLLWL